ncbi:MAG TPA: hypothetical protein PK156_42560, partial [Polyangium sp.]|nr:hypothetical protein [Polyangium sp.]
DPHVDAGRPPPIPSHSSPPHGPAGTFAISRLILGRNDPNGNTNNELWKTIGYNLDFTVTGKTSAGVIVGDSVCNRVNGASFDTIADGVSGRDNAFGSTILPIMLAVNGGVEQATNALILDGKRTLLIDIDGLGSAATYQSLTVRLYEGRLLADAQGMSMKPVFDGSDIWPITHESVSDGMADKPLAVTADGYVAEEGPGGTLVAEFENSIELTLDALGLPNEQGIGQIRIQRPLVTLQFSADRSHIDSGTLAGIIDTVELQAEFTRLTGIIDNTLCKSATVDSVRNLVAQSSDITADGQPHLGVTCNSISIGIQFEAAPAQLGTLLPPAASLQNPCAAP